MRLSVNFCSVLMLIYTVGIEEELQFQQLEIYFAVSESFNLLIPTNLLRVSVQETGGTQVVLKIVYKILELL